jgi:hypothetical protein
MGESAMYPTICFLISFFRNGMTDKEQKINDLEYSLKLIKPYPANVDKMVGYYQC